MFCFHLPVHSSKLSFGIQKPSHVTNIHWKFQDFLPSSLQVIKVFHFTLRSEDGVHGRTDGENLIIKCSTIVEHNQMKYAIYAYMLYNGPCAISVRCYVLKIKEPFYHTGIHMPPLFFSSIFSSKQFLMLNYKETTCLNIKDWWKIEEWSCCLVVPLIENRFCLSA